MTSAISRREALQRAVWLLGGTLSAPTILGVRGYGYQGGAGCLPESLRYVPGARCSRGGFRSARAAAPQPVISL